jgi:UDP-glucose 4-epimerase
MGREDLSQRLCASLQVDISKARTLLAWRPPVTMEAVLQRTAEYFLSNAQSTGEDYRRIVGR